jgi:hypothetical protein
LFCKRIILVISETQFQLVWWYISGDHGFIMGKTIFFGNNLAFWKISFNFCKFLFIKKQTIVFVILRIGLSECLHLI